MSNSATADRPARYWTDTEIAWLLHHVRTALDEIRSGVPLADYVYEDNLVRLIRGGASTRELVALGLPRLDAEMVHAAVALMAGSER